MVERRELRGKFSLLYFCAERKCNNVTVISDITELALHFYAYEFKLRQFDLPLCACHAPARDEAPNRWLCFTLSVHELGNESHGMWQMTKKEEVERIIIRAHDAQIMGLFTHCADCTITETGHFSDEDVLMIIQEGRGSRWSLLCGGSTDSSSLPVSFRPLWICASKMCLMFEGQIH